MRILILGDVHGNLEALQAVLRHAEGQEGFEAMWCLGDTVGYGPDPGPCLDLLAQHAPLNVAGNHDYGAVGMADLAAFNDNAALACRWTAAQLSEAHKAYLKSLPTTLVHQGFTMAHGSLRDPIWEYLVTREAASATFQLLQTRRCLVSHSHVPFLCQETARGPDFGLLREGVSQEMPAQRLILNPGSVGQPRDGDPRASYLLLNDATQSVTLHRVAYDIPVTQKKMAMAGLPEALIRRLALGN